ncbi:hypothetical protein FVR03_08590 [Pontibacter qinzhouensis]|uniref:Lipoprotein n=1 Tax=Pontibacter qinzhouensis TaxID=2603253 RepID=A0A5C8KCC6_9BACT|nr:hypothetical protein [Pontibacter qinzhouensis]TXK48078.1 hypothetical protein FVR03_08590 [Pontibacter qinzhouensis]
MKKLHLLLPFLLLLLLASCTKDTPNPLPAETRDWLAPEFSTTRTFYSELDEEDLMQITVKNHSKYSVKKNVINYQAVTINFESQKQNLHLEVEGYDTTIKLTSKADPGEPRVTIAQGHYYTYQGFDREYFPDFQLLGNNIQFVEKVVNVSPTATSIKEFYYAKNAGLIGYKTSDGKLWSWLKTK